jgi:hypothetical protein
MKSNICFLLTYCRHVIIFSVSPSNSILINLSFQKRICYQCKTSFQNVVSNFFLILATQEADIRRIMVQSQPGQIVLETLSRIYPSQPGAGDSHLQSCYSGGRDEDGGLKPAQAK